MSSSLLPPRAASTLVSTASARMTSAISSEDRPWYAASSARHPGPPDADRRHQLVPLFSRRLAPHVDARSLLPLRDTGLPRVIPSEAVSPLSVYGQPIAHGKFAVIARALDVGSESRSTPSSTTGATSADTGGAERSVRTAGCPEGRAAPQRRRQFRISSPGEQVHRGGSTARPTSPATGVRISSCVAVDIRSVEIERDGRPDHGRGAERRRDQRA